MVYIKEKILSYIERIKSMTKTNKIIALSILAAGVAVLSLTFGGLSVSYDVIYNGEKVAQVSDLSVYRAAVKLARADIAGGVNFEETAPIFKLRVTLNGGKDSAEALSAHIIENSSDAISGYSISLPGKEKLYVADKAYAESIIAKYCSKYDIEGLDCESTLAEGMLFENAYIDESVIADEATILAYIDGQAIKTSANVSVKYEVDYETLTTRTTKKAKGYQAVTVAGVKGVNEKVEKVTYIDGVLVTTEVLSDTVITLPVTEEIIIGTGRGTTASVIHNASTKGYVWPLEVRGVITSYWGDGRNHKGLDIAAPAGTEIHAVFDGTVTFAGWCNDYGYNVIIDHGNGVQTRYAHSRKLHVKVGDVVTQGQFIAEVGTTGQSTGNHCHFEVIINGTRVNPAPYLGI